MLDLLGRTLLSLLLFHPLISVQASPIAQYSDEAPHDSIISHKLPPGNYLPPGRPPNPLAGHRPSYVTIFTEADITFCRPFPSDITTQNAIPFFSGTPLNLTCWAHSDFPAPVKSDVPYTKDIWVRTEGTGCFIDEKDLRNTTEINYEDFLNACQRLGPQPLGGNNPLALAGPRPAVGKASATASPVLHTAPSGWSLLLMQDDSNMIAAAQLQPKTIAAIPGVV